MGFIVACGFALLSFQGSASSAQKNATISLLGRLHIPGGYKADVWGYFDAVTGKEYALVGYRTSNTDVFYDNYAIVDVTNPAHPAIVANINAPGHSIKTWKHYAYSVNGGALTGRGQIVDIADPANPKVVGSFSTAHTVFFDQQGYMYLSDRGLMIYNLNPDPLKPQLVWSDRRQGGHEALAIGNRLYDFHGFDGTFIYDITDRAQPNFLARIVDSTITFHHSGWVTEDGNYLFICDEAARHPDADITIWDIRDATSPRRVGAIADDFETAHNIYIIGRFAYTSYYGGGFRVFDVFDPPRPKMVDEFVTTPHPPAVHVRGAFGCYPFAPSGNIYVSDIDNGLFIFSFKDAATGVKNNSPTLPPRVILHQNYPNPFNAATVIRFELPEPDFVKIKIYDIDGREVAALVADDYPAGAFEAIWEASNVAGGFYFCKLQTGSFTDMKKILLVK
jgi:hypothetical protein